MHPKSADDMLSWNDVNIFKFDESVYITNLREYNERT